MMRHIQLQCAATALNSQMRSERMSQMQIFTATIMAVKIIIADTTRLRCRALFDGGRHTRA